jgi:hypothetical protein
LTLDGLLERLRADQPAISFRAGPRFCWSPATGEVFYKQYATAHPGSAASQTSLYSLLHETGHALLKHKRFQMDFELLEMEVAAWERARGLAARYGVELDEDHIQDCLDTYRDWLYRRSICPSCTSKALQLDGKPEYRCFNCQAGWRVSSNRFCRPYRQFRQVKQS